MALRMPWRGCPHLSSHAAMAERSYTTPVSRRMGSVISTPLSGHRNSSGSSACAAARGARSEGRPDSMAGYNLLRSQLHFQRRVKFLQVPAKHMYGLGPGVISGSCMSMQWGLHAVPPHLSSRTKCFRASVPHEAEKEHLKHAQLCHAW